MKQQLLLLGVLLLIVFSLGFYTGRKTIDPDYTPEIKYVDKYIPNWSKNYALPSKQFVYLPLPIEKLRRDTIHVPVAITKYVIAEPDKSIRFSKGRAIFTYYDPSTLSYGEKWYTVPQKAYNLMFGVETRYFFTTKTISINPEIGFYYQNFGINGGYWFSPQVQSPYIGFKYNLTF